MVEVRWRQLGGSALMVAALAAGGGSVLAAVDGPWWDPPPCPGGPGDLAAAVRDRPALTDPVGLRPWSEVSPILDAAGALTGQRLTVGIGADDRRLDLPAESFAAGPFGRVVLIGDDDGSRSRLRALDVAAGCAWFLGEDPDVIRRATIDPAGTALFEMRVARDTRADLGIWGRDLEGPPVPRRIMPPIAVDDRFGRTWSTEFTWSVDEDRVAIQSCAEVACRTRILDPGTGSVDFVDDPDLGPIVGLSGDRLVVYQACRGLPCPLLSIEPSSRRRAVISDAAGPAALTGRGPTARIVHEWRDGDGRGHVRSVGLDGGDALDLGRRTLDPTLTPVMESSR